MSEGFPAQIEERIKRLLGELEIPPPVPERSPIVESTSAVYLPQEIVRTYYPALDLYIHAELPKTSTLPAISIPFSLNTHQNGKITLYKTDKPLHEIEKGFIESILEALVSHLNALSKELRRSTSSLTEKLNAHPKHQGSYIQEKRLALWNGEFVPFLSQAKISAEKNLATLKAGDGTLGSFNITLHGSPVTEQHHEFLIDILDALSKQIIQLGYQQATQKIIEQKRSWEDRVERLLTARSPAEILSLFCEIASFPYQAFLLRHEKSSDTFEIISQWRPQPHIAAKKISANILLKTVFYPEKVLSIPANTEIPNTLRELKAFIPPEEGMVLIPLMARDEPEGCIFLIMSGKAHWESTNEREVLQLAKVAALVLHRLSR